MINQVLTGAIVLSTVIFGVITQNINKEQTVIDFKEQGAAYGKIFEPGWVVIPKHMQPWFTYCLPIGGALDKNGFWTLTPGDGIQLAFDRTELPPETDLLCNLSLSFVSPDAAATLTLRAADDTVLTIEATPLADLLLPLQSYPRATKADLRITQGQIIIATATLSPFEETDGRIEDNAASENNDTEKNVFFSEITKTETTAIQSRAMLLASTERTYMTPDTVATEENIFNVSAEFVKEGYIEGFGILGCTLTNSTSRVESFWHESSSPSYSNAYSIVAGGGYFIAPVKGKYTFQIATDDDGHVQIGSGESCITVAGPPGQHGMKNGQKVSAYMKSGAYSLAVQYGSVGGPSGIQSVIWGECEPDEPSPDAKLIITPDVLEVNLKNNKIDTARVSIVGGHEEDGATYEVRPAGETPYASLNDITITPSTSLELWGTNNLATATFDLWETYTNCTKVVSSASVTIQFSNEKPKEKDCFNPCYDGTKTGNNCIDFSQSFGRSPWIAEAPESKISIHEVMPRGRLFTPKALMFDHPLMRRVIQYQSDSIVVSDGCDDTTSYRDGKPTNQSSTSNQSIRVDTHGNIIEILSDRTQIVYNPATGIPRYLITPAGVQATFETLEVDVITLDDGTLRQLWSRADGLMDITPLGPARYRMAWYPAAAIGEKETGTGLYAIIGNPAKTFTFGSPEGEPEGNTFALREYRDETFNFNYSWTYDSVAKDWIFVKGSGIEAVTNTRALEYSPETHVWQVVNQVTDINGVASSTSETILENGTGNARTGSTTGGKTNYTSGIVTRGNGLGRIAAITNQYGVATGYTYDTYGRTLTQTTTGFAGLPQTTISTYLEPLNDGAIDRRPRTVTQKIAGTILTQTTYIYTTNALGGRLEETRQMTGGITRTTQRHYYPAAFPEAPVSAGRILYEIDAVGRAIAHTYTDADCAPGIRWRETVITGLWVNGAFETAPGRSERTIHDYDMRGDRIRSERFALIDEDWYSIDCETHTYNLTHKAIKSEWSNGKTAASEWICTGPVWERTMDGIVVSNRYDSLKRCIESTRYSPFGNVTTHFTYDAAGRILQRRVAADALPDQIETNTYDNEGRLVIKTDAAGYTTETHYSDDNRVTTVVQPNGATRTTTLNEHGHLLSITGSAVTSEYYTYGVTNGLLYTQINYATPNSPRWRRTCVDGLNNTVREEQSGYQGQPVTTTYTYNTNGQITKKNTPLQPDNLFTYNAWGEVFESTQKTGSVSRIQQNTAELIQRDGEVWRKEMYTTSTSNSSIPDQTELSFTQCSNLSLTNEERVIFIDLHGTEIENWSSYNAATATRHSYSRVSCFSNISENVVCDNRLLFNRDSHGVGTTYTYDAYGRLITETDGRGNTSENAYDIRGRLISKTDASGNLTTYYYNMSDNLVAVTNALGHGVSLAYDLKGHRTSESESTYPVRHEFDDFGQRIGMTTFRDKNTAGDTTRWAYDPASGLPISKTYPDGATWTYTYTPSGQLATRTDARGIVTRYTYGAFGLLNTITYSDGTPSITLTNDALGRPITAVDALGTTTFTYTPQGNLLTETISGLYAKTLTHHTDEYGRDTGHSVGGTRLATYFYDSATGALSSMATSQGTFAWEYLPGSRLKSKVIYPNGATAAFTYEEHNDLLTKIENSVNNAVISRYTYTNDSLGRRTQVDTSGTLAVIDTINYTYNARDELRSARAQTNTAYSYDYLFDDIGNRRRDTDLGTSRLYTSNTLNQYTKIFIGDIAEGPPAPVEVPEEELPIQLFYVSPYDPFTPAYDANGNQTTIRTSTGTWRVTYNAENRPAVWVQGNNRIEMIYDRMGRRVSYRSTTNGSQNTYTKFLYNGYTLIQQVYSNSPYNIYKEFVWDPTEPEATRPLQFRMPDKGVNFFYLHDADKNVSDLMYRALSNGIAAHYDYAPFGALTRTSKTSGTADYITLNPYRFSSEYHDDELGLVYYNYRHYNPADGRWTSRDPIEENGGFNLYAMVQNNPFAYSDYLGRICISKDLPTDGPNYKGHIQGVGWGLDWGLGWGFSVCGECDNGTFTGSGSASMNAHLGVTVGAGWGFSKGRFNVLIIGLGGRISGDLSATATFSATAEKCSPLTPSISISGTGTATGEVGSLVRILKDYKLWLEVGAAGRVKVTFGSEINMSCNREICTLKSTLGVIDASSEMFVNVYIAELSWKVDTLEWVEKMRKHKIETQAEFKNPFSGKNS